jgi:hypothetical protein
VAPFHSSTASVGDDAVPEARVERSDLALVPPLAHPSIVVGTPVRHQGMPHERATGHRQRANPERQLSAFPRRTTY